MTPVPEVLDLLRCPVCAEGLGAAEGSVRCPRGHAFDLARQGYLNLLGTRPPRHADTAAMVAARDRFLGGGHYRPVADALVQAVRDGLASVRTGPPPADLALLEAGAGTGYYLAALLAALPARGLAFDISPAAARRAARAHPRLGAVVADTWQPLPVRDAALDAVTCVFAPRNPAEFARVLRPDGVLVVVGPLASHLAELRATLGLLDIEEDKQERLAAGLSPHFSPVAESRVQYRSPWPAEVVADLVAMGPSAFHLAADQVRERVATLPDPVEVEVAVSVTTWRRRS